MLICGSGLGTGILAVPYAVAGGGLVQAVIAIAVACAVSMVLHLMVADLALHSRDSTQLLGIFEQHLFRGRLKKPLSTLFFVILIILLLFNLTLYITCAAEVAAAFGLPMAAAKLLFYAVASLVVALGIKSIGVSEKLSMAIIGGVVLVLGLFSFGKMEHALPLFSGGLLPAIAIYSLCMFSFSTLFAVPQVVTYIKDRSRVRRCILGGIGLNAAITFVFALIVNMATSPVTEVATVGLSRRFGAVAVVLCSIFVLLAMLTSFLSIALAQIDILREKLGISYMLAWLAATLPSLLMAWLLPLSFISYVEIVGGVVAVIVAVMVLPSYVRATGSAQGPLLLGRAAKSRVLIAAVLVFYLLMAAGSLIPTN